MRLNRRVPVGTHGGVRGRLSDYEDLLLDWALEFLGLLAKKDTRTLVYSLSGTRRSRRCTGLLCKTVAA